MANQPSSISSPRWTLGEALDLPLALEEERLQPNREADLRAAQEAIEARVGDLRTAPENAVLHAWLCRWRRKAGDHTIGEQIEDALRNAGRVASITGLLLGLVAASDRLIFTGPEPLNVFALLGAFVFAPLALSALLLLTLGLRRPGQGNWVQQTFLFIGRKLARWGSTPVTTLPGQMRANASWSSITRALGSGSRLLQAPVLALSQKLALGFGVGLLLMLHFRVSFWELAFGWQTTLNADGTFWHLVTSVVSAPWAWFWPEAVPTMEQIAATRYSRLGGAAPINAAFSRAWWPFLAASIFVWSILLRAGVLVGLRIWQGRRLASFDPRLPEAQLLLRRLRPSWSNSTAPVEAAVPAPRPATASAPMPTNGGTWLALVPDEPDPTTPQTQAVEAFLHSGIARTVPYAFDDSVGDVTVSALQSLRAATEPVAILLPSGRDPIEEVADTLRAIEQEAGEKTAVLLLQGPPERLAIWKRKLATWGVRIPAEFLP
jgi:hypothetical protein